MGTNQQHFSWRFDWLFCEYIGKNNSISHISRKCNTCTNTIRTYLKKFNIPFKEDVSWSNEEKEKFEEYAKEMTFKEIYDNGLINRTYKSMLRMGMLLDIKSIHNKNKSLSLETKKKISCSQRDISIDDFKEFTTNENLRIRNSVEYSNWRQSVFVRDNWICQMDDCIYCKNEQGVILNAHHIKHFSTYPDLRFDVDNGITYCADYHLKSGLHQLISNNFDKSVKEDIVKELNKE